MNRRDFVASCASATAVAGVGGIGCGFAIAQGGVSASIAETVATNLAKRYGGAAADKLGLGSVWNFLNGDGSSSDRSQEILDKLDAISQQLQQISTQINALQNDMVTAFARENFDTVVAPVQALMSANDTLKNDYRALLVEAANDRDISGTLGQITEDMKAIYQGPATWNNALIGNPGTSVIVAASRMASGAEFYTQDSAHKFQGLWDLLDAQQAMTLFYYVEHLNATKQQDRVLDTVRTYLRNRQQQMLLLRGQERDVTETLTLSISGNPRKIYGRFSGPALPPLTIVAHKPPYTMWSLQLTGPVPQGDWTYDRYCAATNATQQYIDVSKDAARGAFDNANEIVFDSLYFARPVGTQFEALVTAAGGTYDGDPGGQYVDALRGLGFVFPDGTTNVWTSVSPDESETRVGVGSQSSKAECYVSQATREFRISGRYFNGNNLYRENGKPDRPCDDASVLGASIYLRNTQGQYFYP
jgi:hypothetical protein